jgi:hypothetical protein
MRRIYILPAIAILLVATGAGARKPSGETPAFAIDKPTLLAFFRPSSDMNDTGTHANDSLSDFRAYLHQASDPLQRAGIEIHEVDSRSFQVRDGGKTTTFTTKKMNLGYCLVAPGKKPRVEYGLMSPSDLVNIASEYFGMTIK